jgi:hypothetical protein
MAGLLQEDEKAVVLPFAAVWLLKLDRHIFLLVENG